MIKLIAAVDSHWGIAKNGEIPWNLPDDLRFFRERTINGVVVMGRRTFFSIGRPLENRVNCVVSTTLAEIRGIEIFRSFEDVVCKYNDFWVIGGAQLYDYTLKNQLVDCAWITHLHQNYNADKFINQRYMDNFSKEIFLRRGEYSIANYCKKQ